MIKLDQIQKIALSGLFLALTIIFTRFLSIQNIPVIPFVRISLGPCLIIFSSLLLGPIYGAVVGGLSDILGIVLVPSALGYGINPWFTIVYTFLGIFPWLIYFLFKKIKQDKIFYILTVSFMACLIIFLIVFLSIVSDITLFGKDYHFEWWMKLIIVFSTIILGGITSVGLIFINKYFRKKYQGTFIFPYKIAFVSVLSEFFILLILNSIVKQIFFDTDFLFIFFSQSIVFFVNISLDTYMITLLSILAKRVFKNRESISEKK